MRDLGIQLGSRDPEHDPDSAVIKSTKLSAEFNFKISFFLQPSEAPSHPPRPVEVDLPGDHRARPSVLWVREPPTPAPPPGAPVAPVRGTCRSPLPGPGADPRTGAGPSATRRGEKGPEPARFFPKAQTKPHKTPHEGSARAPQ